MSESTTNIAPPRRTPTTALVLQRCDVPESFSDRMNMSQVLGHANMAGMLPEHLRERPEAIFGTMLHAQALDIPMWIALQHTFVIEGSWGQDTALTHALVLRAGHKVEIVAETPSVCTVRIIRWDEPDRQMLASFHVQEARLAGLMERKNWRKYPADMMFARALGRAARRWCRDVVLGFAYTRDELEVTGDRRDPAEPTMVVADQKRADDAARLAAEATADDATRRALEALAVTAEKQGLLSQVTPTGESLRDLLRRRWDELAPAPAAHTAPEAAPAPSVDTLPCGCRKLEVVASGGHRAGCSTRRAVVTGEVVEEPPPTDTDDAWAREQSGWDSEYGEDL